MKKYFEDNEEPIVHKFSEIDLSGMYSYASYLRWEFEERLEIIKGQIYKMGVPSTSHQTVAGTIFVHIFLHLKGNSCRVFIAPFDVRLTHQSKEDKDITTVVQPDLCVICDPGKIDDKGGIGAPDVVVEVLSPGNNRKELQIKYALYEEFGVKEYWIVHLIKKIILKHVLNVEGKYSTEGPFTVKDQLTSSVLPGFNLDIEALFNEVR